MIPHKTLILPILLPLMFWGCNRSKETQDINKTESNISKENNTTQNALDKNKTIAPADTNKTIPAIDNNQTTKHLVFKTGTKRSKFPLDDATSKRGINHVYTRSPHGITDTITTLLWQDNEVVEKNWQGAVGYCQSLTIKGISGWRLPRMSELLSIVDVNQTPTIDGIFKHTKSSKYWTATEYPIQSQRHAYFVNFANGTSQEYARDPFEKRYTYAVRCVKGEMKPKTMLKKDDTKKVIIDENSMLMWSNDEQTSKERGDLPSALRYCENATIGGYADWYLPNINELYTITDRSHYDGAIHPLFDFVPTFGEKEKDFHTGNYWSSSHFASNGENGKIVHYYRSLNIQNGASRECRHYFTNRMHTRCVRAIK